MYLNSFFISLFLSFCIAANAQDTTLVQLDSFIKQKEKFDQEKRKRIDKLENDLQKLKEGDLEKKYNTYLALYEEYKTFDFNKAFEFSNKLEEVAALQKDSVKIAYSKMKKGFILLSSGMFKETFDALKSVNANSLTDSMRAEYYFLTARSYYDLADYDKDQYFSPRYVEKAGLYIDSAGYLCNADFYRYRYFQGLKNLKLGNITLASDILNKLLSEEDLSYSDYAVIASTLSDIYIQQNNTQRAIYLLAKAATADIKASTKEAAAMVNLAQILYQKNDVKNAYTFINAAMDDANFYGARQRKVQVSALLKVISGVKVNSVEEQRRVLTRFVLALAVLSLTIIAFAIIIYRQLIKLRKADRVITKANESLKQTIVKLNEADKIKEEYIGYYFNINSEYLDKLALLKKSIASKLEKKNYDDIKIAIDKINLHKERENLYLRFDKTFLQLFPNFVDEVNKLFKEEDQFILSSNQELNTELRIFALTRMGITDNDKIAHILDYSVNTIYAYKNRVKNKSIVPNDKFDDYLMKIRGV